MGGSRSQKFSEPISWTAILLPVPAVSKKRVALILSGKLIAEPAGCHGGLLVRPLRL